MSSGYSVGTQQSAGTKEKDLITDLSGRKEKKTNFSIISGDCQLFPLGQALWIVWRDIRIGFVKWWSGFFEFQCVSKSLNKFRWFSMSFNEFSMSFLSLVEEFQCDFDVLFQFKKNEEFTNTLLVCWTSEVFLIMNSNQSTILDDQQVAWRIFKKFLQLSSFSIRIGDCLNQRMSILWLFFVMTADDELKDTSRRCLQKMRLERNSLGVWLGCNLHSD